MSGHKLTFPRLHAFIFLAALAILALGPAAAPLGAATGAVHQLSTTPDWTAESNQADSLFGSRVSTVGDVNGDGYDDVTVVAFRFDSPDIDEGKAFLYLGSATGLSTTPAWTVEGDQAGAQLSAAAKAGDVNGDGFDDVIVGVGSYDGSEVDEGRALLYLGSAAGLSTTPSWVMEGNQAGAFYGGTVIGAGDVNSDGFADVLVGAAGFDNGQVDEGMVFLYHGSASGLSTTPDWTAESDQAGVIMSRGSGPGDLNGDGFDDVAVGCQFCDNGQNNEGRVFLFKGSSHGLRRRPFRILEIDAVDALFGNQLAGAGDINADGYDDLIVNAPQLGGGATPRVFVYMGDNNGPGPAADLVLQADPVGGQFGISLNTAGDVNADGFADIIIGARTFQVTLPLQGRTYVYAGSATGLNPVPLQVFDGTQAGEESGVNVNTAGDVNGDGFADIIIGAHAYDNPESNEGRALVFHGGP